MKKHNHSDLVVILRLFFGIDFIFWLSFQKFHNLFAPMIYMLYEECSTCLCCFL